MDLETAAEILERIKVSQEPDRLVTVDDFDKAKSLAGASPVMIGAYIEHQMTDILNMFNIRDNCTSEAINVLYARMSVMFKDLYDRDGVYSFKIIKIEGNAKELTCITHYQFREYSDTTGHCTSIEWYVPTKDEHDYSAFDRAMKGI